MSVRYSMARRFVWICCLLVLIAGSALASIEKVHTSVEVDLTQAIERLSELRKQIADEKVPLMREYHQLKKEVAEKRRQVDRNQRIGDSQELTLIALEKEVEGRRSELDYVSNLMSEFRRNFETRLHIAEVQAYEPLLHEKTQLLADATVDEETRITGLLSLLKTSQERAGKLLGGNFQKGKAIGIDGVQVEGEFALYGPIAFFSDSGGKVSGWVEMGDALEPSVKKIPGSERIADLGEGRVFLGIDPTLGEALAIQETQEGILQHILKGGIWIYPILGFAGVAALLALFKTVEIFGIRQARMPAIQAIVDDLNQAKVSEAKAKAAEIQGPFGAMLQDAVDHYQSERTLLDEVIYEHLIKLQNKLERLLPYIAVIAATSPLLGLLGTVTGMINTFKLITIFGTGDARPLSSGISEALVTTEFGLIVAIPTLIAHAFLYRKALGVISNMERLGIAFQNGLTSGGVKS